MKSIESSSYAKKTRNSLSKKRGFILSQLTSWPVDEANSAASILSASVMPMFLMLQPSANATGFHEKPGGDADEEDCGRLLKEMKK